MALRVGFIGYGGVARSHADDFEFFDPEKGARPPSDPEARVVAGCDIRAEAREAFRERTGVTALYDDYEEMLEREGLDLVTITTCADVRVGPTLAAARRGVHVLCEKPMGCDVAECDEMVEACEAAGVQLVISHQRRCDPYHWQARRLVDQGLIGQPRLIRAATKQVRGGPQLHNIGTHLLDAMGILVGEPRWVHGRCEIDGRDCAAEDAEPGDRGAGLVLGEYCTVQIRYENGVEGFLESGERAPGFGWELLGDEGILAFHGPQTTLYHYPGSACVPGPDAAQWRSVEMDLAGLATDSGYEFGEDAQAIREERGLGTRVFMLRELFQRMQAGGEHTSCGRVGRIPMEIIQATFVSHLGGSRVYWPLEERRGPLA